MSKLLIEVGSHVVVGAAGTAKKGVVAFVGETQVLHFMNENCGERASHFLLVCFRGVGWCDTGGTRGKE